MFLEDLHLDGADAGAITWGDEIPDDVRADAHVVVIGCGESGLLAGIRLAQAGLPFTIIEKNAGPGGTWWENRYPGARVDVGSHFYCYSFEPADHWTEYFSQQPELQGVLRARAATSTTSSRTAGSTPRSTRATCDEATGRWAVDVTQPRRQHRDARRARRDQRGRRAQPRRSCPTSRAWTTSPGRRSTRPAGTTSSTTRASGSRSIGAGASGFQIAPTIADDVAQLTVFQRTAQWMFPNPNYHRARARR